MVGYLIASLFYFELDLILEKYDGKYIVIRYILYLIRRNNLVFKGLFNKLRYFTGFLLNSWPILKFT